MKSRSSLACWLLLTLCPHANAHDYTCSGREVPSWIKATCCGKADAHAYDSLREDGDGNYHLEINGKDVLLPQKSALPSQDACFWVFYNESVSDPVIFCFLIPMEG